MKGLFLNLPNSQQIMRRYMCSYNSPTFLFQPIELLSLAGIHNSKNNNQAYLIDAIAEKLNNSDVLEIISRIKPDYICSITGFECFEEDINEINKIKENFPNITFILFGHYATEFHSLIAEKTKVDFIIHGEPDLIFDKLVDSLYSVEKIQDLKGITYRKDGEIVSNSGSERIRNTNQLPMPAFELLKNEYYSEPFFPKPYGLLQSARGCPYSCNYCVKSFGTKLGVLSSENMILQLEKYIELHQIKSFRFIDDTFTATPKRVIDFCRLMINKGYNNLTWSCLARADTLQPDMLEWMKKAGCKRIYIGVESASSEILDFYNKKIDLTQALTDLKKAKSMGFELFGFFMVGAPFETTKHVEESIAFAVDSGFEFVTISSLIPYPGTPLFEKLKNDIEFSILPYKNEFKDSRIKENAEKHQRYFMKNFYTSPSVILTIIKNRLGGTPKELILNSVSFIKYLLKWKTNNSRKDYI